MANTLSLPQQGCLNLLYPYDVCEIADYISNVSTDLGVEYLGLGLANTTDHSNLTRWIKVLLWNSRFIYYTALTAIEKNNNQQQTIVSRKKTFAHEMKVSDKQLV